MPAKIEIGSLDEAQLQELRSRIDARLKDLEERRRDEVIEKIRNLVHQAGLSARELTRLAGKSEGMRSAPPPKFRHPEKATVTWSGRGAVPAWVREWEAKGKSREALRIKD